jgi:hypothetical protein
LASAAQHAAVAGTRCQGRNVIVTVAVTGTRANDGAARAAWTRFGRQPTDARAIVGTRPCAHQPGRPCLGPKGEQRALQFFTERDAPIATFVREIGWRTVARSDEQMTDVKFAYLTYCKSDRPEAA